MSVFVGRDSESDVPMYRLAVEMPAEKPGGADRRYGDHFLQFGRPVSSCLGGFLTRVLKLLSWFLGFVSWTSDAAADHKTDCWFVLSMY